MKNIDLTIFLVGLNASFAYDDLSHNKDASQSHTVKGTGFGAENAVDGNTATCMRTEPIGPNSPDKTVWWKVDLGGVYNIYSVNILFKNYDGYESRQQGRFAGFSLYISNTGNMDSSSLCYKDGPELPPLNFSTECTLSGRYVIFYNERLDGVAYPVGYEVVAIVYTELCEVIVKGCGKPGVYGSNCNIPCPNNCRYSTCHIHNGTCFECEAGYKGAVCATECPDEWYGFDCKQQCSGHCRDNVPCNKVTGQCDKGCAHGWYGQHCEQRCVGHCINNASCIQANGTCDGGCAPGWIGSFCEKECSNGAYGYGCVNNCSGHCMGDSPCNKQTGHCDRGCDPGYTNASCSKECSSGTYGKNCTKKCSEYCLHNKSCNHIDGACTDGCQDGYKGNICNISCESGRYGKNCSHTCSKNCKTCKHTDGTCSCYAGWSGPNCSIGCTNSYGENCQYLCHPLCANQTCDRFDGTCAIASKMGCLEMLEHSGSNQKEETWTAGLSVSIGFNALLLAVVLFLLWRQYKKVHCGAIISCWESSLYEKSTRIDVPEPTYQELVVKENPYQNTTIN
uniref:Multiple epidermal growth factor-like domains protein 10 isoform X2 n=1 Tax=Crassostrea virginica TaxID=6565 RepID=A0A8B8C9V8_CRAVI|nr:multiple epidermal growth factor-like domains protein 10 isoform X2 [Crassostrea virginica]